MRVQIHRVSDWRDPHGKGPIIVQASEAGRPYPRLAFRTFDPWKASVCERAQVTGTLVDLTYRLTRGRYRVLDLVTLVIEPAVVEQAQ